MEILGPGDGGWHLRTTARAHPGDGGRGRGSLVSSSIWSLEILYNWNLNVMFMLAPLRASADCSPPCACQDPGHIESILHPAPSMSALHIFVPLACFKFPRHPSRPPHLASICPLMKIFSIVSRFSNEIFDLLMQENMGGGGGGHPQDCDSMKAALKQEHQNDTYEMLANIRGTQNELRYIRMSIFLHMYFFQLGLSIF